MDLPPPTADMILGGIDEGGQHSSLATSTGDSGTTGFKLTPESSPATIYPMELISRSALAPAACLACRKKHLKCEGKSPCARCLSSGTDCVFVASRRGGKQQYRHQQGRTLAEESHLTRPSGSSPSSPTPPTGQKSLDGIHDLTLDYLAMPADSSLTHPFGADSLEEQCIGAYYHFFFSAHPFVLPRDRLSVADPELLRPLRASLVWIGCLFLPSCSSIEEQLLRQALNLVRDPSSPRNGFLVQAMVLLVVALDGRCKRDTAIELLRQAEKLALAIGLNKRDFASRHGQGSAVLEESWRRTWWDLYVVDALIAGVHQTTNFALFDHPSDAGLPCEEAEYLSGRIPPPMSVEDLELEGLSDTLERPVSSFSHRITCAMHLGTLLRLQTPFDAQDESITQTEGSLTNWLLYLPESKRDCLQENGAHDEMMFQAHMINQAIRIMLHRPFSQLDSWSVQAVDACSPQRPVPTMSSFNLHTRHVLSAARAISNMVTHSTPLPVHTHFFACVLTQSSAIHLSRWAISSVPRDDRSLMQLIRLNIGALKHLSRIWVAAAQSHEQVSRVAKEIRQLKEQMQLGSQLDMSFLEDDVLDRIVMDGGADGFFNVS